MNNISIDYHELSDIIKIGMTRHNKPELMGIMLCKHNSCHLSNQEEWDKLLDFFLQGMTHNIICELERKFEGKFILTEEDEIISFDKR
jgi:hypothetical protein